MDVTQLKITNIGQFSELEMALAPTINKPSNVTVLVGNNGSGKTSILNAISFSLGWLISDIIRDNISSGEYITKNHINKGQFNSSVEIAIEHGQYQLKLFKNTMAPHSGTPEEITKLAQIYREQFAQDNKTSFPLIAFYNAERYVRNIPLEIKTTPTGNQFDGFTDALAQSINFEHFFQWFREREDIENESAPESELTEQVALEAARAAIEATETEITDEKVKAIAAKMLANQKIQLGDPQLSAVRHAISAFIPNLSHFRVRRSPQLYMSVEKAGVTLNVEQLSQGEKILMALVGDIARRLAILNPSFDNPLHGDGIVLIDEADLHLHPQWQRTFIARLTQTFPNCQFVLTTHSPLMISDSKDVLCYLLDDGALTQVDELYGLDANQVLLQVMDTDVRNAQINDKLNQLLSELQHGELKAAQTTFTELSAELPNDHIELAKAKLMIRKLELRRAKNH